MTGAEVLVILAVLACVIVRVTLNLFNSKG